MSIKKEFYVENKKKRTFKKKRAKTGEKQAQKKVKKGGIFRAIFNNIAIFYFISFITTFFLYISTILFNYNTLYSQF